MNEDKPKGIAFYLMGAFNTALFIIFFSSMMGSLSVTEPIFLPALASQLNLTNSDVIDDFLTTTPLPVPTVFQHIASSVPFLIIFAFISINFFNFSKLALMASAALAQSIQLLLAIIASLLFATLLFSSPSIISGLFSFIIFALFLAPFFLLARITLITSKNPKLWNVASYYHPSTQWYQQWPLAIISLLALIIYFVTRHLLTMIGGDLYPSYLKSFIAMVNSLAAGDMAISPALLNKTLNLYKVVGYSSTAFLIICFIFIITKRSIVAVAIAALLIICNHAKMLVFVPLIKHASLILATDANLYLTVTQIILLSLLINATALFYLIKNHYLTLKQWHQDGKGSTLC